MKEQKTEKENNISNSIYFKEQLPHNTRSKEHKNLSPLLQEAIEDPFREKHGLAVVFSTSDKYPAFPKWQEYAKKNQTEEDIINLYNKRKSANKSYSYFTGIGGLIDFDFDWEWVYHVALRKFKDRMNTRTFKTPNGGYRCLYIVNEPKDFLDFKEKPPYVEIHGNIGKHHVIVHGKSKDENGDIQAYKLVNNVDIVKDDEIIPDMINFLKEINEKCQFLEYNCICSKLGKRRNHLTQEQRTFIGAFFVANNVEKGTAVDFFRTCPDFDFNTTEKHMEYLYEKEFKHPTCDALRRDFNLEEINCKGCIRKSGNFQEKIPSPSNFNDEENSEAFDLTQIDENDIFWVNEHDGVMHYTDSISETPIFALDNRIYYVIPFKSIAKKGDKENKEINVQGFYGFKSGYGVEPVPFYIESQSAFPAVSSSGANVLLDDNQQRTIELEIKEALRISKNIEKRKQIIATKTPRYPKRDIQNEIKSKLSYYMNLEQEMHYLIITCFILGTYLFPLFVTFGYLIISGEKGAGKGTLLDLLGRMCWNPTKKLVSIREAPLFRSIKTQLPTMLIDEYHRAVSNPSSGSALVSILESGYERGGVVPRTEEYKEKGSKKYRVVDYPVYCPKILATRGPVEADEKGIKIIIPKIVDDELYAKRKKELLNDSFFENVRKHILRWLIQEQSNVLAAYNSIQPTKKLSGREFNVWLPVLAIGKIAFPNRYNELFSFAEEMISKNRNDSYEKESRVLNALYRLYIDGDLNDGGKKLKSESYKVTNKEISNSLEFMENEGMHHIAIRSAFDNLKIVGYHNYGKYYIKKEILENKFKERGYPIGNELLNERDSYPVLKVRDDRDLLPPDPGNELNIEDIPQLSDETIRSEEIIESYNLLVENNSIALKSFVDKLGSRTNSDEKRCWGVYQYISDKKWTEFISEGWIKSTEEFREYLENL